MPGEAHDLAFAITDWSSSRPLWEQVALAKLARGESIAEDDIHEFADIAETQAREGEVPSPRIHMEDFAIGTQSSHDVRVLGISEPTGVNALAWEEGISFYPTGITLIYGENGSGKSGRSWFG